ncbi:PPOX class F420-dependent oxidoreductase [Actinoalloteichus spitiensis]|uniref:PPOX class F420-dependent oxidoreductase n=1 Tax=Actinoalloteichus spitiensis TaxID=252394 RepID=UPI000A079635|nr:PPOX class F420-dependent oxidoreductase [Actinoalloteichus spitiensis]
MGRTGAEGEPTGGGRPPAPSGGGSHRSGADRPDPAGGAEGPGGRTNPALDRLGAARYLAVTTFRRSGRPVVTPVWVARDGDALVVWTVADSGKVKRVRHTPTVRLAPCDVRGRVTGPETGGRAVVLGPEGSARARRLVSRRYGLLGWLLITLSTLRRGRTGTVGLRIVPAGG